MALEIDPTAFFSVGRPKASSCVIGIATEIRSLLDRGVFRVSPGLRAACDLGGAVAARKADERRKAARARGIDLDSLLEEETQALWIEVVQAPELRLQGPSDPRRAGVVEVVRDSNGVKLSRAQSGQSKRLGAKAGWPDLHHIGRALDGSICLWLVELKVSGGSVGKSQEEVIERLQGFGADIVVCWGLADLSQTLLGRLLQTASR